MSQPIKVVLLLLLLLSVTAEILPMLDFCGWLVEGGGGVQYHFYVKTNLGYVRLSWGLDNM